MLSRCNRLSEKHTRTNERTVYKYKNAKEIRETMPFDAISFPFPFFLSFLRYIAPPPVNSLTYISFFLNKIFIFVSLFLFWNGKEKRQKWNNNITPIKTCCAGFFSYCRQSGVTWILHWKYGTFFLFFVFYFHDF